MRLTFQRVLILFAAVLSLASTMGLGYFFISLYRSEKIASLFDTEQGNVKRIASHFENLVKLVNLVDIRKVEKSREIIFVTEDPCHPNVQAQVGISSYFAQHFRDLGLDPLQWSNSLEVYKRCEEFKAIAATSGENTLTVIPSQTQLFVPYVLVLVSGANESHRLGMISLDGFRTSTSNTLFLTREDGKPLWAADGADYLTSALFDTGVSTDVLAQAAQMAVQKGISRAQWAGPDGLLSYAPTAQGLAIMSLSYAPAILSTVHFVIVQVSLLAAGVFLLCFLTGKKLAEFLSLPLQRLQAYAERIGMGDFSAASESKSVYEFGVVFDAFNVMRERILKLIDSAKKSVAIEKQLVLATQVQKLLIPPPSTELKEHLIFGTMKPAEHIGGDWWGYLEIERTGRSPLLLLMVGDATDHGVPPALITATVKGALSVLSIILSGGDLTCSPTDILRWLNRTIHDAAKGTLTMSMVAAIFDLEKKQVQIANAGHVLPYLLSSSNTTVIPGGGNVLGQTPEIEDISASTSPWNPGDRMFLYTDGLTDLYEGEVNLFDRKALSKFLRSLPSGYRARETFNRVLKHREKLAAGLAQSDDLTVVVCEAKT